MLLSFTLEELKMLSIAVSNNNFEFIYDGSPLWKEREKYETLEEKLICYADKFFSKSGNIKEEKSIETVIASMQKHGDDVLRRFRDLHEIFKKR